MKRHHYPYGVTLATRTRNKKTGWVNVLYLSSNSCPVQCPLYGKCYKDQGNMGMFVHGYLDKAPIQHSVQMAHYAAERIAALKNKALTRDLRLFGAGDAKSPVEARIIAKAAREFQVKSGRIAFGYTHAHLNGVKASDWKGVSMLASCETPEAAKRLMRQGWATAIVMPYFTHPTHKKFVYDGVAGIPCPNQTRGITCTECRLCMRAEFLHKHKLAILFAAHSSNKKYVANVIRAALRDKCVA